MTACAKLFNFIHTLYLSLIFINLTFMHTKRLYEIFSVSISKLPDLLNIITESDVVKIVESKKYDVQDEALIDAIVNDKGKQLEESLREDCEKFLKDLTKKNESASNTDPLVLKEKLLSIFITNLEYYIDYYYNSLINKLFSDG